jgi:hypothetical protein
MDVTLEETAAGILVGEERWYLFLDGITDIRKFRDDIWTIQQFNGAVLNIAASAITEQQLEHIRAAMERGRTPEGVRAVIERGKRIQEIFESDRRNERALKPSGSPTLYTTDVARPFALAISCRSGGESTLIVGGAQPPWLVPVLVAASIAFYVALGWGILQGYRWLRRAADAARLRALEGLKVHNGPAPGLVAVVFHTYYGFIVFVVQTEHRFWAPPDDAREALWRLHRFNLSWGMFAYGVLVIPFLSFGNYLAQKRSIGRQQEAIIAERPDRR